MKYLLLVIFGAYILLKPPLKPAFVCHINTIQQAVPPVVWYEQTIDGSNQKPILTRFLHNKANIFASEFAKCYSHKLDPVQVYKNIGLLGLIFWVYFIWFAASEKKWLLISLFLLAPFGAIFTYNSTFGNYSYKIFAIIGLWFFIKNKL